MSGSTARAGLIATIAAACTTLMVDIKNAALPRLLGTLESPLADVAGYVTAEAEAKLAQLVHYIASLPVGSELVVLAEGFAVKVVGNGLPQHGAGTSLLQALEEALGIPSVIQGRSGTPLEQIPVPPAAIPVLAGTPTPTTEPTPTAEPTPTPPLTLMGEIEQELEHAGAGIEAKVEAVLHGGTPSAPTSA